MSTEKSDSTRDRIKTVARRLFCQHGVDDVSIRDILTAAGQRNIGAIGYYFQNKDALVSELLRDGAKIIDIRRNAALDALEKRAAPVTLHDVVSVLVRTSIDLEGTPAGETYTRFLSIVQRHNLSVFMDALSNQHDGGFRRCIAHLRRLLPEHSRDILNERIIFLMIMVIGSLSFREAAVEQQGEVDFAKIYGGRMWVSETVIDNLIAACEGILTQPAMRDHSALANGTSRS